ncbi:MAG: RNA methyltransferase [Salinarimonadaceae bacterium]|nr:MAG: RNA methyltransferase [Salinarimonadaceae bacterium]
MRRVIPVSDPHDPRIAAYRDVRERDLVGRLDRFVAEGEVVLRQMARAGRFAFESLLIAENRVAALADLVSALPDEVPVYVAGREAMKTIVGFPIHRGALAIGVIPEPGDPARLLARPHDRALAIGCVGLANHDNVGGIFRNAAAFGAQAVLLDAACCDPLYRKAIRVSVGAALTTPFARCADAHAMLDLFAAAGFEVFALTPRGAVTLEEAAARAGPRRALLLGAEGPGLPEDVIARATGVRIDMAGGFDSLNVATTAGIALYALSR